MRGVVGTDFVVANHLEKTAVNSFIVIPSEVEESREATFWYFRGISRLRFASLGKTPTL
jgi:hypothetical protein